jgi:hypothetical protein
MFLPNSISSSTTLELYSVLEYNCVRRLMTASINIIPFSYGHYYARIPINFQDTGKKWIKEVNDTAYPEMVEVLGFSPQIDKYIIEFVSDPSKPAGYYEGKRIVDNFEGGHIVLQTNLLQTEACKPYPRNLEGGLVYETIHGFLQPLKFRSQWSQNTVLAIDESFDILFETELDFRLGLDKFAESLHKTYYRKSSGQKYFCALWDIRDKFGWTPFQRFFEMLDESPSSLAIDNSTLSYYLSKCIGTDVATYFIKHGFDIKIDEKKNQEI